MPGRGGASSAGEARGGTARWACLAPVALALVTAVAFAPALRNGFVDWDDSRNLISNPHWRGLAPARLAWIATASHGGHYMPVTWLTYAVDYTLWGLEPAGYHLTSILFHAAAVVLCYAVARRLLRRALAPPRGAERAGAAAAALLFGLHPLRVESVAWVTERRDVVAGVFFLAAVLFHLRGVERGSGRGGGARVASIAAHAAALLSKSITLTTPAVLLLLDVYPLRRIPADPRRWLAREHRPVLLEKLPYLALSLGVAVLAVRAQILDRGIRLASPWSERLATIAYGAWFYPLKTVLPVGLSPLYEAPARLDLREGWIALHAAGALVATAAAWLVRARWPGVPAAWAYYLITLAPVSGVLSLGELLAADRYSYLPCLGFAVLAGGAVARMAAPVPGHRRAAAAGLVAVTAVVALLGVQTWRLTLAWRDTLSLWTRAVAATPWCAICHVNLGHELLDRGAAEAALRHFERAAALRPDRPGTFRGVGLALSAAGRRAEAIAWYRAGLARVPSALALRLSLAGALAAEGRPAAALETLDAAWHLHEPAALGRYFEQAVASRPADPTARAGLGLAWLALGEPERAREAHRTLERLDPALAGLLAARLRPAAAP
jgi:tetratricopeptide (TPR) repeat protein